jgi:hypothetical protein
MAIVPGTDTNKIQCNTENMGELEVHETTRDNVSASHIIFYGATEG